MRLWWDKGILWISLNEFNLIAINSYEALDLLQKLEEKIEEIELQAKRDLDSDCYKELDESTRPGE